MSAKFLRHALCAVAIAPAIAFSTAAGAAGQEPLKIGFVYVSPIGEAGWTRQHDIGRKAMEQGLGDNIKTQLVDDVPEGADAHRGCRDLESQGHTLSYKTS